MNTIRVYSLLPLLLNCHTLITPSHFSKFTYPRSSPWGQSGATSVCVCLCLWTCHSKPVSIIFIKYWEHFSYICFKSFQYFFLEIKLDLPVSTLFNVYLLKKCFVWIQFQDFSTFMSYNNNVYFDEVSNTFRTLYFSMCFANVLLLLSCFNSSQSQCRH